MIRRVIAGLALASSGCALTAAILLFLLGLFFLVIAVNGGEAEGVAERGDAVAMLVTAAIIASLGILLYQFGRVLARPPDDGQDPLPPDMIHDANGAADGKG